MNRGKSPPINLDKYLVGKEHRYCTYNEGARLYCMNYWSFVTFCKEAGANFKLRKTALVDLNIVDKYIEENFKEEYNIWTVYMSCGGFFCYVWDKKVPMLTRYTAVAVGVGITIIFNFLSWMVID
ncbi:DUF6462 family protein [Pseudobutyrivibrio sp.]|jgi:hypothetical protein|uniref:DUF6462 family protein n=1 Tax=Pseudobutyrivibrio sp. TaxID=2014367 RepID=UPI0025CC7BA7|nr:DUF6462 family protein [Pseudobutyrivibrio sp.]